MKDCIKIMKNWIKFNICFAISLVLWTASSYSAQKTAVGQHGWLQVKGNKIVNERGESVILRGMSLFWSQWIGKYYNVEAIKWLKEDWNCEIVRAAMAVEAGGYLTNPEREKKEIETVINAAIDLGIYVIIDWHDHNAHRHIPQAQEFFAEMAKKYGNKPNVIYELWNEPLNIHDWGSVIKPYHEAVIPKIREYAPRSLIVCGTQTWSQDVDKAARDPLKFDNVAYTLHFYAATHKQGLRNKALKALQSGIAIFVTEWGTSEASGNGKLDYDETQRWLDFMKEHQLSWCNWSLADKRETSAALMPAASPNGGWSTNELSPSGLIVRSELRKPIK